VEVDSTSTTLLVDTMLQDDTAAVHTYALQLWEPTMKLLPNTVTVLPAYTTAGITTLFEA
jgi:hypothetical protein